METVMIDCDRCEVRGLACDDCVISVLMGVPGRPASLTLEEQRALRALADSGLVHRCATSRRCDERVFGRAGVLGACGPVRGVRA